MKEIALSTNDDKRIQSVDSTETYAYRRSEYVIHVKEKIIINTKMFNFDYVTKEVIKTI